MTELDFDKAGASRSTGHKRGATLRGHSSVFPTKSAYSMQPQLLLCFPSTSHNVTTNTIQRSEVFHGLSARAMAGFDTDEDEQRTCQKSRTRRRRSCGPSHDALALGISSYTRTQGLSFDWDHLEARQGGSRYGPRHDRCRPFLLGISYPSLKVLGSAYRRLTGAPLTLLEFPALSAIVDLGVWTSSVTKARTNAGGRC